MIAACMVAFCSAAHSDKDRMLMNKDSLTWVYSKYEDTLCSLFNRQSSTYNFDEKLRYNSAVMPIFDKLLNEKETILYDFGKLSQHISITTSPDKKVRIFCWDLASTNGLHTYFAMMQVWTKNGVVVHRLVDKSDEIDNPEQQTLNKQNWYGALYYNILMNKVGKKYYYTLLGWDGNDLFTDKKIVDVLCINSDNEPVFGAPMFCTDIKDVKVTKYRVFFEYSYKCSMTLTYNAKLNMIVFDHLSPVASQYRGMYEYYGTDFSYDGFVFEDGKWKLKEDLDVRNPKPLKKKPEQ